MHPMHTATFEFYGNLLELLPHPVRRFPLTFNYAEHNSIKHLIESLGVPHTEVAAVVHLRTERRPDRPPPGPVHFAGLSYIGFRGCTDSILGEKYQPEPDPRFLLDNHLGRLASYLRLTGFDTLYDRDSADAELAETAVQTGRILLTRDRRLLMRKQLDKRLPGPDL